jgi:hypothetical protein
MTFLRQWVRRTQDLVKHATNGRNRAGRSCDGGNSASGQLRARGHGIPGVQGDGEG